MSSNKLVIVETTDDELFEAIGVDHEGRVSILDCGASDNIAIERVARIICSTEIYRIG